EPSVVGFNNGILIYGKATGKKGVGAVFSMQSNNGSGDGPVEIERDPRSCTVMTTYEMVGIDQNPGDHVVVTSAAMLKNTESCKWVGQIVRVQRGQFSHSPMLVFDLSTDGSNSSGD